MAYIPKNEFAWPKIAILDEQSGAGFISWNGVIYEVFMDYLEPEMDRSYGLVDMAFNIRFRVLGTITPEEFARRRQQASDKQLPQPHQQLEVKVRALPDKT